MEDLQKTYPGAGTFTFGASEAQCNALLSLVRQGKKRATCEVFAVFEDDLDSMPKAGRCDIAANWDGTPALVIKTLRVKKIRFCDVTEEMALAEGEFDSLSAWQKGQQAHFDRKGGFDPEMLLVFEHFELVEDLADR